jgi:hypothetical protein
MCEIHDLRPADTGMAYDISQTSDEIHDGDVLIADHNGRTIYAVMCSAWPTSLDGYGEELMEDETFQFHFFADIRDIYTIEGGKYVAALDAANAHAEGAS